jgi:hypothetical protein
MSAVDRRQEPSRAQKCARGSAVRVRMGNPLARFVYILVAMRTRRRFDLRNRWKAIDLGTLLAFAFHQLNRKATAGCRSATMIRRALSCLLLQSPIAEAHHVLVEEAFLVLDLLQERLKDIAGI